jgi:hypothetical protein
LVGLAAGLDQADLFGEIAEFAVFEQGAQRQLDVTGLTAARDDLCGQQRVPAEGEEIVAQTDPWQTQHFTPDRGDLLLQLSDRFDVFTHLPLRLRQGARSSLPLGLRGIASRRISCAGTMYSGSSAASAVFRRAICTC